MTDRKGVLESTGEEAVPERGSGGSEIDPLKAANDTQPATASANTTVADNNPLASSLRALIDGSSNVAVNSRQRARSFKAVERVLALLANVAIVAGIIFAFYQIRQATATEKRRVAIEAVNQTRSAEFLKAYRILKSVHHSKQIKGEEEDAVKDSLNLVMNVYDNIAVVYINDVADKCIIKKSIESGAREMSQISDFFEYPVSYKNNFNSLLSQMEQESCE